ncbi:30S ribosomal protein S1 [Oscillibacter valericigenes]|uniref:S1 RNA-binding domain-containing protein n=1 Tax=Oscillibacter valericigenes TaxID=351091 RepID=UPI001F465FA1|nr:S1 RNA-binding domain-containing protein [Oscillibacter valericigenes]MCF2665050.1 30S ribosomal protein S1 [Oscillibacter valericigenes]
MPENKTFPPEGLRPPAVHTLQSLKSAVESGEILEAVALRCDVNHTLHFSLNGIRAVMQREEINAPWISGSDRDIAILSRVGKPTCFTVQEILTDEKGAPVARLSRRAAQEKAMEYFLQCLRPGSVLACRATRLESFGVFLDIGCGIVAMLPIEHISVSRISHTKERFRAGQKILAVVLSIDPERRRFTMTHRELLGTWMENASWFRPGETVPGVVRSVQPYGSFIELTPNLSGLADTREDLTTGDRVSVFIKSIRPERMKIKLQVIEKLPPDSTLPDLKYQITDGVLDRWVYSPPNYEKAPVETVFLQDG